jgi:hypothetical protein
MTPASSRLVSKTHGNQSPKNLLQATTRATPRVATRWWYPRMRAAKPAGRSEHMLGGPAGAERSEHPRAHTPRNPRGQHQSTRHLTLEQTHGGSTRAPATSHSTKPTGAAPEHPRPHTPRNPRGQHQSTRHLTLDQTHGGSNGCVTRCSGRIGATMPRGNDDWLAANGSHQLSAAHAARQL